MKLKDFVTLGNLLGGFAAVIALFVGAFDAACYLIYVAYVFDTLDGPVAKLTGQQDRFGPIFDTVCDYITNSIAASFIIFYGFWQRAGFPWPLAATIAAFPFTFGTIRQAKGMEKPRSYPCYWLGVPRPVLAMFALAMINSSLFSLSESPWRELSHYGAAGLIVVLSLLHLSTIPFVNHHQRRWMNVLRLGALVFLAGSPLAFVIGWTAFGRPRFVYDYLLFCFMIYVFLSWTQIPREDIRRIRAYLSGGPLVKPLVHRDSDWRSTTMADFFLAEPSASAATEPSSGS